VVRSDSGPIRIKWSGFGRRRKLQIPTSNIQRSSKLQASKIENTADDPPLQGTLKGHKDRKDFNRGFRTTRILNRRQRSEREDPTGQKNGGRKMGNSDERRLRAGCGNFDGIYYNRRNIAVVSPGGRSRRDFRGG
jgi:hypothetical protein